MQYMYYRWRLLFLLVLVLLFSCLSHLNSKPKHINLASEFIGIHENNYNRGYWIDIFNEHVGNKLGSSWCAAYVWFICDSSKVEIPLAKCSGLARNLVTKNSIPIIHVLNKKYQIKIGDILIWQKGKTIYGHTGFAYINWNGIKGYTIEGNTSSGIGNQSDGDGIYKKFRGIEPYNYFRIKWITQVSYE